MLLKLPRNFISAFKLFLVLGILISPETSMCKNQPQSDSLKISNIALDQEVFNPSVGEKITIHFQLSNIAKVSVRIFDFDRSIVATACKDQKMAEGNQTVSWNGKDREGNIVPNEAYFFTIEATNETKNVIYDPSISSGGITHEIERTKILPESQQLEYYLPEKARVCIKAGIIDGPLLAIPLDWEPRIEGHHLEPWDGLDNDKIFNVLKQPHYKLRTSYFTLPENSILTRGNRSTTYFLYKNSHCHSADKKPFSLTQQKRSILRSPLYDAGLIFTKSLPIEVRFLKAGFDEIGIPLANKESMVQVDFAKDLRAIYSQRKYEFYLFLDNQFVAEHSGARIPYKTPLYWKNLKPGMHTLSVNIISPDSQIGIKNIKFKIN